MQNKIKNKIEQELKSCLRRLEKRHSLSKHSPLLFKGIKDFILRKGKRLRPLLFVIGYKAFAKKTSSRLYGTALAFELLHDFMLIHDDIVDKASTRRGEPCLHVIFERRLQGYPGIKFNGRDLAIIAGDVVYAAALDSFLSIQADPRCKEKALREFIQSAVFTASGEFSELLSGAKHISRVSKEDIYKIYDYKTAYYTFSAPLVCGATLGGAKQKEINKLRQYGLYLGRAFQIQDDTLGLFGEESKTGKSPLTDLQEAKKTLLIWRAYQFARLKQRLVIKKTLAKNKVTRADLAQIRRIVRACGALDFAKAEVQDLNKKALALLKTIKMRSQYKAFLNDYSRSILNL